MFRSEHRRPYACSLSALASASGADPRICDRGMRFDHPPAICIRNLPPVVFMLRNYVTIALRSLRKQAAYSLINVFGLAIGLACCLLLLFYVRDELSADRFHEDADRIYRVVETHSLPGEGEVRFASSPGPVGPALEDGFPEVEETVRVFSLFRPSIYQGEQGFYEAEYLVTEPGFFSIFDFEVLRGDAERALEEPGLVVLTESAVRKYFGTEDPVGQTLEVSAFGEMSVAAVLRDPPRNSHLDFSMLFSVATTKSAFTGWEPYEENWQNPNRPFTTYIKLREGASAADVEARLPELYAPYYDGQNPPPAATRLQPLADVYFGSDGYVASFSMRHGQQSYLYIFGIIAVFIVVIACINYMNLATARSMRRAREVGLRKTVGAYRSQLAAQFLTEAVLTVALATGIALLLAHVAMPAFNGLAGKNLGLHMLGNTPTLVALLGLVVVVGVVAGSYPALFLARARPAHVLKGGMHGGRGTSMLRRGLVVAQFTLSIGMIIGTLVASSQLEYIRKKNLGFDETQKLVFDINSGAVRGNADAIRTSFLQNPAVRNVSVTSRVPGDWKEIDEIGVLAEGSSEAIGATFIGVDSQFLATFDVNLLDGRNLDAERPADSASVLINETAAAALGWSDPVGRRIRVPNSAIGAAQLDIQFEATVIGIVEDFHFRSLHEPIRPLVLGWLFTPITGSDYITASVATADLAGTIAALIETMANVDPANPVEMNFLDQRIGEFYVQDRRMGRLFGVAAGLAILVACLGLFGLAAYTAEQRTKEIGVRKVLGASVGGIVALLSADFMRLVGIAFILAAPPAYFAMRRWLEDFAYRAPIGWSTFALAGLIAFAIALLTVSYQSVKAAKADPVRSLRYE